MIFAIIVCYFKINPLSLSLNSNVIKLCKDLCQILLVGQMDDLCEIALNLRLLISPHFMKRNASVKSISFQTLNRYHVKLC